MVNLHSTVAERIVLPRIIDLVNDIIDLLLAASQDEQVTIMILDICNAFHLLPLHPTERKYFTTCFGDKVQEYMSMVFGPKAAPTVWGRFGAWLGRSTQALFSPDKVRIQLYVDDPALAMAGAKQWALAEGSIPILWW